MNYPVPYNLLDKILYFVICPLIFISFLLESFTNDVLIYLGTAKVALITGGFPMNLDSVWESRFVGHRFLYYVLNLISPFKGLIYSIWIKLIVGLITLVILYYFSKQVSEKMQIPFQYPFIIGFLGFFAVNGFVILSAEFISIIIGMVMLIFLLQDARKELWILSSLCIVILLILKGLTVLVLPIVILVVIMFVPYYKSRFKIALYGLPIAGILYGGMALYFPHFISDIFLVTKIAHLNQLSYFSSIIYFFQYGIRILWFIPIIIIGIVVLFELLTIKDVNKRRNIGLLLGMWIISILYVLVISEFFYYHYYLMLFPALFTICYFLCHYAFPKPAFWVIVILTLVVFTGVVAEWSPGLQGKEYVFQSERERVVTDILSRYDLLNQSTILYLDTGESAYFFPVKSASRYVGAIPYQRDMPGWDMKQTPAYWENLNESLAYRGKYVIVNPTWFNLTVSTHSAIADKLDREYVRVYVGRWDVYLRE